MRISVPVYEEQQVRNAGIPNVRQTVRATPDAMGAGIGKGLDDISKVAGKIALEEKEKADLAQLTEFDMQRSMFENSLEEEALQIRGKDAINVPDEYLARRDDGVGKLIEELPEHLREKAQLMTMKSTPIFQKAMLRHSRSEQQAYQDSQYSAYLENASESAGLFYSDSERVALEISRSVNRISAEGVTKGWSAEEITERKEKQVAGIHMQVLARAVMEKDWRHASAYFEANEDDLKKEPDQWLNARKLVDQAKAQGAAIENIKAITTQVQDKPAPEYAGPQVTEDGGDYTFDQFLDKTFDLEKGYVADDLGSPTMRGIRWDDNKEALTALGYTKGTLKNLTKEDAAKIYRQSYWSAVDAESLPLEIRAIAADAAVNHGANDALRWIEQSGGDFDKYYQLRKNYYDYLVRVDPVKYSGSYSGWMNRLSKFKKPSAMESIDLPGRTYATLEDYLAPTMKIEDPVERELTQKGIRQWYKDSVKPAREARLLDAANAVESGVSYFDLPADLRGNLSSAERKSLMALDEKVNGKYETDDDVTSFSMLSYFQEMATDPKTRKQLEHVDVVALRAAGHLTKEDAAKVQKLKTEALEDKFSPDTEEQLSRARNLNQLTTDYLDMMKIDPGKSQKHAQRANEFRARVNKEVESFERNKGSKATESETREILDRLTMEVTLRGTRKSIGPFEYMSGDDDVRLYEAPEGELLNAPDEQKRTLIQVANSLVLPLDDQTLDALYTMQVRGVPAADRAQITAALEKAGQPVTEANIFRYYVKRNLGNS